MDISEVRDLAAADRYWAEKGPPTAVELHMAVRSAERALVDVCLAGVDHGPALGLLRQLLGSQPVEAGEC